MRCDEMFAECGCSVPSTERQGHENIVVCADPPYSLDRHCATAGFSLGQNDHEREMF